MAAPCARTLTAVLTGTFTGCRGVSAGAHTPGMTTVLSFTSTPIGDGRRCPSCGAPARSRARWWCRRCGEGGSLVDYEMLAAPCRPARPEPGWRAGVDRASGRLPP
jgi:hypothetical protein